MLHLLMHDAAHAFAVHANFEKVVIRIIGAGNIDEHGMEAIGGHYFGFGRSKVMSEPTIQFAGIRIFEDSIGLQCRAIREIQSMPGCVIRGLAVD